jgi:hypothetical protein
MVRAKLVSGILEDLIVAEHSVSFLHEQVGGKLPTSTTNKAPRHEGVER